MVNTPLVIVNPINTGKKGLLISSRVAEKIVSTLGSNRNFAAADILDICQRYHGSFDGHPNANVKNNAIRAAHVKEGPVSLIYNICVEEELVSPTDRGFFVEYSHSGQAAEKLYSVIRDEWSHSPVYIVQMKAYAEGELPAGTNGAVLIYNPEGSMIAHAKHIRLRKSLSEFQKELEATIQAQAHAQSITLNEGTRIMGEARNAIRSYREGRTTEKLSVLIGNAISGAVGRELKIFPQIMAMAKDYGLATQLFVKISDADGFIQSTTHGLGSIANLVECAVLESEAGIANHVSAAVKFIEGKFQGI